MPKLNVPAIAVLVAAGNLAISPQALAEFCRGFVTEVVVQPSGDVWFRHTGLSRENNRWGISACNLRDGATCEGIHRTLTAAYLSGGNLTVSATRCSVPDRSEIDIRYMKLEE